MDFRLTSIPNPLMMEYGSNSSQKVGSTLELLQSSKKWFQDVSTTAQFLVQPKHGAWLLGHAARGKPAGIHCRGSGSGNLCKASPRNLSKSYKRTDDHPMDRLRKNTGHHSTTTKTTTIRIPIIQH